MSCATVHRFKICAGSAVARNIVRMRVRTALALLLAVNVLWAVAFIGYAKRSTTPIPSMQSAAQRDSVKVPAPAQTNVAASVSTSNAAPFLTNKSVVLTPKTLASSGKEFGWQDVTNDTYLDYVARLRAAGAPDKQIRNIVISDVNDLFDQRRLEQAVKNDTQWWRAETFMGVLPMQNFNTPNLDDQRRDLLTKILGEDATDSIKLPSLNGNAVQLTGPVLGALPVETWSAVQEACARSMERHQAFQMAQLNAGGPVDNVELAKLRDKTRTDLAKVLTAEELEEFLLRYSHNSSRLRTDLRGIEVTPDEFRKFFRAIDPLEHQIQLDYGGPEALSAKQKEHLESQRDQAAREALTPENYAQFVASKDPLYKNAQVMAMQYGLNGKAVQPLHEMQKSLDARRTAIRESATLTEQQKTQALQSISIEHQQKLQQIIGNATYRN